LFGHLALEIGGHGALPLALLFQLTNGALLEVDLRLQFRNFFTLDFDKGLEASRMGVTGVVGTFPRA
jgi:hypothetical protein